MAQLSAATIFDIFIPDLYWFAVFHFNEHDKHLKYLIYWVDHEFADYLIGFTVVSEFWISSVRWNMKIKCFSANVSNYGFIILKVVQDLRRI